MFLSGLYFKKLRQYLVQHTHLREMIDITSRRQAEQALRESESRAAALLNAIPDMMFRMNSRGVFLDYRAGSV